MIHASAVRTVIALVAVREKVSISRTRELDLLDLVGAVARGRRDLDVLAGLAPDQRPAERRIVADRPWLASASTWPTS